MANTQLVRNGTDSVYYLRDITQKEWGEIEPRVKMFRFASQEDETGAYYKIFHPNEEGQMIIREFERMTALGLPQPQFAWSKLSSKQQSDYFDVSRSETFVKVESPSHIIKVFSDPDKKIDITFWPADEDEAVELDKFITKALN